MRPGPPTLRLTTIGRKSGEPRVNGLYYVERDGNLIVAASNAGDARVPAWWLMPIGAVAVLVTSVIRANRRT